MDFGNLTFRLEEVTFKSLFGSNVTLGVTLRLSLGETPKGFELLLIFRGSGVLGGQQLDNAGQSMTVAQRWPPVSDVKLTHPSSPEEKEGCEHEGMHEGMPGSSLPRAHTNGGVQQCTLLRRVLRRVLLSRRF